MTTDGSPPPLSAGSDRALDPVLVRRAQMARLAKAGNRVGYACLGVSVVAFFVGLSAGYELWGRVVVAGLAASALTLAPAIVLGYAVKAAEREERGERFR
ncbi:MAG: hypothetical protein KY439_04135 [Actinobacteria bacterium]|nr:hypothetical protein [Actinomycetota bacterium]